MTDDQQNSSTLTFTALEDDSGNYTCTAANISDSTFVTVVPAILSGPMNLTLEYSDDLMATFYCTAFGGIGAEIEFSWSTTNSRTGFSSFVETLNADNSTSTATTNILSLQDREGEYECAVYYNGSVYENDETAILSIVPAIVQNPLSITGPLMGQTASFNCTAYSGFLNETVSLIFTWSGPVTINSSDVMTSEHFDFTFTSILTLENVTMDYEGNYSCSVAYSDLPDIQSTSETATLTILNFPTIRDISEDVIATRGEDITLQCTGSAQPFSLPNVYWQNAYGEVLSHIVLFVNYSLGIATSIVNITDIRAMDGGTYTCIAENELGVVSGSVVVYVVPYFTFQPSDILTANGSNESTTCAAEAFPPPTLLWIALSGPVIEYGSGLIGSGMDEMGSFEDMEDLVFDPVKFGDEGVYHCNASNEYGEALTNITVTVSPEGSVRVSPPLINAQVNTSVLSTCTAEGGPNNTFTWSVDTERGRKGVVQEGPVLMTEVDVEDGGLYCCHVENAAGYDEAYLTINVAPVIHSPPEDTNVTRTENFTLTCIIRGFPAPSIEWYFNGSLLNLDGRIVTTEEKYLSISVITTVNATFTDSGEYLCTGINDAGNISSIPPALVLIQDRPEMPVIVDAVNITSDSLILQWLEPHDNNAPLLGYWIVYCTLDICTYITIEAGPTSYLVTHLQPAVTYHFTVQAVNRIGTSSDSLGIIVTTLEAAPTAPPDNVTALTLSSTEVMVQWDDVPESDRNGEITHYEVLYIPHTSFEGQISAETVIVVNMTTVLVGLEEYVTYNISVRANTSAGFGPYSDVVQAITFQAVPSLPPANVSAFATSFASLKIVWDEVPAIHRNGNITMYEIEYTPEGDDGVETSLIVVGSDESDLELNVLPDFRIYLIRVRAYTELGAGPYSDTIEVLLEENVPSGAPLIVRGQALTSTSIQVTWSEVPIRQQRGTIINYEVEYKQGAFSSDILQLVNIAAPVLTTNLTLLHEYTDYLIRVRAYTSVGPGPYSDEILATTYEDRPSQPPVNIVITSISSTSIQVSWDPVPEIHQNGIITGYDVTYNQSTFLEPFPLVMSVRADGDSVTLTRLEEYVVYSIRVRAYTSIGAGPYSPLQNIRTPEDVPSGYPGSITVNPLSPNEIRVQWEPVPLRDRNGIITHYEVAFNQSTIDTLPLSGSSVNDTELSATVGPLQPFIEYTLSVRAFTSVGAGPFNPTPNVTMSDPSGLSLSVTEDDLVVKEGDDLSITCVPSTSTVGLEWEIPTGAVVEYDGPLRHTVTIRNANINHEGHYICRVAGDILGEISSATAFVKVREKCLGDFAGGLFWEVAFDGDTVTRPCKAIDDSFSLVVKVYRRCLARREWTSVDFSGCTLASGVTDKQVIVILSLWVTITSESDELDIQSLEQQLIQTAVVGGGEEPQTTSLQKLPQTIDQYTLLLWKVFYNTADQAQGGGLDNVLCREEDITFSSSTVSISRAESDVAAVMRSDFCECRQVLQTSGPISSGSGDSVLLEPESESVCPNLNIQELCNGTLASPCDCESSQECRCVSPYVGDGSLCVLDSDGDSYPDKALRLFPCADTFTYCSADTCPKDFNANQEDTSPCISTSMADCPAEVDELWSIQWPFTPPQTLTIVTCGVDFVGNATRMCQLDGTWDPPDVTACQSRVFVDIMERAEDALSSNDTEVVLEVVGELVQATAADDAPQLPQDLDTTNEIISDTLDLLFNDLDTAIAQNDTNVTAVDATVIFEALDNILSESNQASFESLQEEGVGSQAVLMNVESFGLYAAQVLAIDEETQPGRTLNITGENMALRAQSIAVDEDTEYSFPSQQEIMQLTLPNSSLANISLPPDLLAERAAGQGSVVVASVLFTTLQSFLPTSSSERVGGEPASLVISSQIAGGGQGVQMTRSAENPVTINFQFPAVPVDDILEERVLQCVFWDFGNSSDALAESGWSVEGVTTETETVEGDLSIIQCSSLHLTSFAVLVDVRGVQINTKALSVVSYIGLSLSMICLLATIIFYISFGKKLFSAVHNFIHLNLSIALFVGYLVFGVGVELAAKNEIACKAVTALIQYFFLSAFCWMMCEGVMLYLMLVAVFSTLKKKWWFFMLLGWGIPLPFVVIGLGSVHDEYGVRDITGKLQYCWLSSGNGTYAIWTFVAPMLAIILINVVFLVLVLRSIYKSRMSKTTKKSMKGKKENKEKEVAKSILKATLILLPLLGLTWVFGLFAVNENTAVFAWLFTIFNSLQGFFIFFFHVLRNKRVLGKMKRKRSLYTSFSDKFGTLTSTLRRHKRSSSSSTSTFSPGSLNLKQISSNRTSTVSESESEWRSESIIIRNPEQLPVIHEGNERDPTFEIEYEDSEFGPDEEIESKCVVEVNLAAADVQ
jgi:hypothetical protein